MAITEVVRLDIQTQQAKANMESLNDTINEQKLITIELERELKRLEQQLRDTPRTALAAQRDLNQQINHVKDSISDQRLSLRELQVQQSQTREIERYAGKQGELGDALKITQQETTGLNMVTGGYASRLRNLQLLFGFAQKKALAFAGSMKVLKTALIATGIGALVVALGLVVAYWEDIVNLIRGAVSNQKEYNEMLESANGRMSAQIKLLDKQIELAGENTKEAENLRIKKTEILLTQRNINELMLAALKLELSNLETSQVKLGVWEQMQVAVLNLVDKEAARAIMEKAALKRAKERLALEEKIAGIEATILDFDLDDLRIQKDLNKEARKKLELEEAIARAQKLKDSEEKAQLLRNIEALENEYLEAQLDRIIQEENAVRDKYFNIIEAARAAGENLAILEEAQQAELQEIRDRFEQERVDKFEAFREQFKEQKELELEEQREKALAELELLVTTEEEKQKAILDIHRYYNDLQKAEDEQRLNEFKILQRQRLAIVGETFGNLATIMGENAAMGKAAASAQALINTYQGITEVLSSQSVLPEPFATIQKVVSIGAVSAIGFKAVKDINKTKVPGGGGATSSGGGGSPRPPSFNMIGDRGGVQDVNSGIDGQDQPPARAYVVGNDVTTQQELDRNAVNASGF